MTGLHSCSASLRQHKADKKTSSKVFGSVTILCFVWTSPGFTEANSSLASDSSVTKDGTKGTEIFGGCTCSQMIMRKV